MFVTKLTPLSAIDLAKLRGQLYFLNEFQAYEYEYGDPVSFPEPFLKELAGYISANGLRGQIALVSAPPSPQTCEWTVGSQATITIHQERVNVNTNDKASIRNIGYQQQRKHGRSVRLQLRTPRPLYPYLCRFSYFGGR
jgi:hypothetical protein